MLKYYVKASNLLERLRTDKDGVVSLEYVIVAVCIIAAVLTAFNPAVAGSLGAALKTAVGNIAAAIAGLPNI
jgi:pilus assembly protein Flp/PilA